MKNEVYLAIIVIMAVFVFQSFATKSYQEKKQESFTDLVCGMKVNSSDALRATRVARGQGAIRWG